MLRANLVFAALSAASCATAAPVGDWCAPAISKALVAFSTNSQELSEDDALDRFEIDEWFLPKLNVELPALFDWGAGDNAYYAHARGDAGGHTIDLC